MLNRPTLVLAPSATLSTEIHTSVPLPNTAFREFFRREALKAVGEPASIAVRLHSLPPRAELPTQRASQGISGVSPRLDTGRNKVEYTPYPVLSPRPDVEEKMVILKLRVGRRAFRHQRQSSTC